MAQTRRPRPSAPPGTTEAYDHKEQEALLRPDIGLQAQFKKKKPSVTYRYDNSLDPELSWDINAERERAERLIEQIRTAKTVEEAHAVAEQLKRLSQPFLNWAGKAERGQFTVPTLPLFVHERLSTKAILESVKTRKVQLDLFADPQLDIADRALRAYEHKTGWVNRLILGDSLQVMNSLLQYEGMGGQVQMIYIDPPYGVKFGSNFQPFIRKRDVKHNDDQDFTREPETVQAYRDTWELGLHSYLTYLRDRFLLAKELLHPTGSIFVQISDENLHHVREVMDEVFGAAHFVSQIGFLTTTGRGGLYLDAVYDSILWYAKDKERLKYNELLLERTGEMLDERYDNIELLDGTCRKLTSKELEGVVPLPEGRRFRLSGLTSQGATTSETSLPFIYQGTEYKPSAGRHWSTTLDGLERLASGNRLATEGRALVYKRYASDFPLIPVRNVWTDTGGGALVTQKLYVVQTANKVIERCILMTTDPSDLVLDPTCGSGTTAYCAEKWGRRWITMDTSRVPLALARQRLLTATFDYYQLRDEKAGVSGGFKYERRQNTKGEEVGGIVPHITLESIAHGEKPKEEVLVDRPNIVSGITRVSGPFVMEATIPTPVDYEADGVEDSGSDASDHYTRMLEALRRSPILRLPGNKTVSFKGVRQPAKSLSLHAEALTEGNGSEGTQQGAALRQAQGGDRPVAFVFGPATGAVSEQLVFQAAKEANARNYGHLYVIGFACQDAARRLIQNAEAALGIAATYVDATMDIQMGDLLKTTRASQVFSVTAAPDIRLLRLKRKGDGGETLYRAELLGLDAFDPVTMQVEHRKGDDVPAWFLDTDYNDLCFMVSQAFFPRTAAWDNLKRALKGVYDDSVWEHLAGMQSEPFLKGEHGGIAVKVFDDRGNELLIVKSLEEAKAEA